MEDMIAEGAADMARQAQSIDDPLARLRFFVTRPIELLEINPQGNKVITAEHWRLHQLYPDEVARSTQHFSDLVEPEIEAAAASGALRPVDPPRDAAMITKLVMAMVHHYAFIGLGDGIGVVNDHLWRFCLAALGGSVEPLSETD